MPAIEQPVMDQFGPMGLQVVEHEMHLEVRRYTPLDPVEEGAELDARWRCSQAPITLPDFTSSAANRSTVP